METKRRRIVYNDDGGSIIYSPHPYPMTIDQYYDCVDHLLGTQVDTYVLCIGEITHREEGGEIQRHVEGSRGFFWRRYHNWLHLESLGIYPDTELINRARSRGLEAIASLRMNDAHFAYSFEGPESPGQGSEFWRNHPECRIDPGVDSSRVLRGTSDWPLVLYDYSHPLIQKLFLDTIDRTFERCDADGFELDFLRHPHFFKPGEVLDNLDVMTEVVRSARDRLDTIGKAKGRKLQLGALVPAVPEAGRQMGLDVLTWIEEDLLDYIVPKHYIRFLSDVPIEEYLRAADGTATRVYACLENWPKPEDGEPIESFRGAASSYWRLGADGIYLYNYFNHRPHPHTREDREILQEIGDPELIHRKDKRFIMTSVDADADYQLPLPLTGEHKITFILGDDSELASNEMSLEDVKLRLDFNDLLVEEDLFEIALNGDTLPVHEAEKPFDSETFTFKTIELDLTQGPLPKIGRNDLEIKLIRRCPGITEPLTLIRLDIQIRYC